VATVKELIQQGMTLALYCEQCDEEFSEDRVRVAPDELSVQFSGIVQILCDQCVEAGVEAYLAHYEF
jgi:formylmethanofuran dehydrogenase subunit E